MWPRRAVEQRPVSVLLEPREAAAAMASGTLIEERFTPVDLPPTAAAHALRTGVAVQMDDPRVKELRNARNNQQRPESYQCWSLDDGTPPTHSDRHGANLDKALVFGHHAAALMSRATFPSRP
jgi:hypothetical protein